VQYRTEHPVYPVLQAIGKEITTRVKPKAVVVFSAHWQSPSADEIHLNNAVTQPLSEYLSCHVYLSSTSSFIPPSHPSHSLTFSLSLTHTYHLLPPSPYILIYITLTQETVYDFYNFPPHFYKATFPSTGSPQLAARIQSLLASHSQPIKTHALPRGLDHGVFSGFNVAFSPKTNPLNVPLVQVSLFNSEDPQSHYALGEAVCALRSEGVVIICTGMSVHNLRDMRFTRPDGPPLPYVVSFDNALKEAVEASPPKVRREKMVEAAARPDARQAHPWMDHLMPLYVAAGAAGEEDLGKQTWTKHEGSFAWAQYRFGELPPLEN